MKSALGHKPTMRSSVAMSAWCPSGHAPFTASMQVYGHCATFLREHAKDG